MISSVIGFPAWTVHISFKRMAQVSPMDGRWEVEIDF